MKIFFNEKEIQKILELYANDNLELYTSDNFGQPVFKLMKVDDSTLKIDWENKKAEIEIKSDTEAKVEIKNNIE